MLKVCSLHVFCVFFVSLDPLEACGVEIFFPPFFLLMKLWRVFNGIDSGNVHPETQNMNLGLT